jgi:hypothetical protein
MYMMNFNIFTSLSQPFIPRLPSVADGWKIVKQFLNDQINFVQAEEELKRLFGSASDSSIWKKIQYINDLDPDELQSQQLSLAQEIDTHIRTSIDAEQPLPPLAVADGDQDSDDNGETRFLLFRVRCFVSWM